MTLSGAKRRLIGRVRDRRGRAREGLFLVEGARAAEEALGARADIRFAVIAPKLESGERGRALKNRLESASFPVIRVENKHFREISGTETPQGILLMCAEPALDAGGLFDGGAQRLLLVDGVQDPGNVGTLIRAALAFSLDGVVVLEGTVDPWNAKVVRAAVAAGLSVPVVRLRWRECRDRLLEGGVPVVVAAAEGADVGRVEIMPKWALVVGNEGAGVRDEIREDARIEVAIPMPGGAESLNAGVAGAILLYALTSAHGPASGGEPRRTGR